MVARIEREIFQRPLADVWDETRGFFAARDPREVERAERDPKHKMALVFRWYIGLASHWAIEGDARDPQDGLPNLVRPRDGRLQPLGARARSSPNVPNRSVVQIALNLLEGAASVTRAQQLRSIGLPVPDAAFSYHPRPLAC